MNRLSIITIATFAVIFGATPFVAAQVTLNGMSFPTIQSAIDASSDGDVILVPTSVYPEALNFSGKNVTVRATGPGTPLITQPATGTWVVQFTSGEGPGAVLEGVQITGENGGIRIQNASPTIRKVRFDGNRPRLFGVNGQQGVALSIIAAGGNTASPDIDSCIFINNDGDAPGVGASGGAMAAAASPGSTCEPVIRNCLMISNNAGTGGTGNGTGAAIYFFNQAGSFSPVVSNCTIFANFAPTASGGIFVGAGGVGGTGVVLIENTILWANPGAEINASPAQAIEVNFCDVQGGWIGAGGNNIDLDPMFAPIMPASQLHLLPGSPCVDAGDDTSLHLTTEDQDCAPRIRGFCVDMGAYELDAPCATPGSGEDFEQRTTTSEDPFAQACTKRVSAGGSISVEVDSPNGGSVDAVPLLTAMFGTPTNPVPLFPEVHISPATVTIYFNGSTFPTGPIPLQGGFFFNIPVPLTAPVGSVLRMQAFGLTSAAPNGFFVASDAHDILIKAP